MAVSINVKNSPYNAVGDGTTDDTAAFMSAVDAINSAGGGILYVPMGAYKVTKPLQLTKGNTTLRGDGMGLSTLRPWFQGPAIIAGPVTGYDPLPTGTSLLSGSGYAGKLTSGIDNHYLLSEFHDLDLNGKSTFSLEFAIKFDTSPTGGIIFGKYGAYLQTDTMAEEFTVQPYGTDDMRVALRTTSGVVSVASTGGKLSAGTVHTVEINYDGTTLRLFVDGSLAASSNSAPGAIKWEAYRDFTLGSTFQFPFEGQLVSHPPTCWIDSIRFSDVVRHTANFTAPTSKFGFDGNTLFLCNFEEQVGLCMKAHVKNGQNAAWMFLMRALNGVNQKLTVEGLTLDTGTFYSSGLYVFDTIELTVRDIETLYARHGIRVFGSAYYHRFRSLRLIGGGTNKGRLGFNLCNTGLASVDDADITQFQFGASMQASVTARNWYVAGSALQVGVTCYGFGGYEPYDFTEVSVADEESDGASLKAAMAFSGCGNVRLKTVTELGNSATPAVPSVIADYSGNYVFDCARFQVKSGLPYVVKINDGAGGTKKPHVVFRDCTQRGGSIGWTSKPSDESSYQNGRVIHVLGQGT